MNPTIKSMKIEKNGAIDWSLPIGKFSISVERTSYEESKIYVYVHDIKDCRQIVQYEFDSKAESNKTVVDLTILLLMIGACRNYVEWKTARRANLKNINRVIERLNLPPFTLQELECYL